jgi:hypothetical protein
VVDEDALALVTVDAGALAYGPRPTHPTRMLFDVPMQRPTTNGLPSESERADLQELERRLSAALEEAADAWFVGRMFSDGVALFAYYALARPRKRVNFGEGFGPYQVDHGDIAADPKWEFLHDFLAPDARQTVVVASFRVADALRARGDDLSAPRTINHRVSFADSTQAQRAITPLEQAGFDVVEAGSTGEVLTLSRRDAPSSQLTFLADIQDITDEFGGQYDGWGSEIVPRG